MPLFQPKRQVAFPEFIALFAMLFATIAFSVDAMLPALIQIGQDLSPGDVNRAQLVVTSFMLGMGSGTLIAGPLSDAYGRKTIVVWGMGLYMLAAAVAAYSQSLEMLLLARFVQGLGASGPRIVTVAMVRDLYEGRAMARVMSFVMTVFILVPALAPSLGAVIISLAGWRAVFGAFIVFGVISTLWLAIRQPETLAVADRRPLQVASLWSALQEVLSNRSVQFFIAAMSFGFGQMFAWLSSAPQIFDQVFDRAETFPLWFAGVALFAGSASLVNAKLVMRLGMRKLATTAFAWQATVSVVALVLMSLNLPAPWNFAVFFVYMCCSFFSIGLTFGNLNALALEDMGHIAGMASAVVGSLSTVLAVIIAIPIGQAFNGTAYPAVLGVLVCSSVAYCLMVLERRTPNRPKPAV
ncbi:multidrug effflux MFS transporter [Roseicitreum antarcticum]|uniref:Bcr/CflA family efflux transporter n=1 Tax=Roseicitreum antarcticum TaxID=564137 RepID=A0A1H3CI24_9RHOB|nr:multidrug effflux MFS transporter [Roseicitreum antarcticum]SDX53660.1 MFS transporter, DHA1 family, bicyclomycin/chloramphenicol resistance protein [Roseicitreum antarcticum]